MVFSDDLFGTTGGVGVPGRAKHCGGLKSRPSLRRLTGPFGPAGCEDLEPADVRKLTTNAGCESCR